MTLPLFARSTVLSVTFVLHRMQNDKWNGVNPYPNETPLEKAARHKAKRAEAVALGIKNQGT